jgi:hypothetical protein
MRMKPARSLAFLASVVAMGLGLGGGDLAAKPKPPPIEAPPPPPMPPPMPDVGLSERFVRDAAAYESYMREASAISADFGDPVAVADSLRRGVAYEPGQFQRGEVAYAAIAALQDRAFVAAVRAAGQTPEARYTVVGQIFANPANALTFTDGPVAAGLAKQALAEGGLRLFNAGVSVRRYAYDVQHQPWSHGDVADRESRLSAVKQLSVTSRSVSADEEDQLRAAAVGQVVAGAQRPAAPPYSPLVIRATALAALAAIGQAGDDMVDRLSWLSEDYFTEHCLGHAKRELNECLAVAKPNYEDIFCLGQPTMMYTGECVLRGADATAPLDILTRPIPIPPLHASRRRRHG